jgi:ANTAR domain
VLSISVISSPPVIDPFHHDRQAVEEGIASIMSTPLMVSATPVGAINMYSHTGGAFGTDERQVATFFARRAGEILGEAVEVDADQGVRISDALTSRDVIAMAQGVHMDRLGISAEAAAGVLYRAARTKEITVRDEAVAVLDSTRSDAGGPGGRRGR